LPSLNPIKYIRFFARIINYNSRIKDKTNLNVISQLKEVYKLLMLNQLEPREYYNAELYSPHFSWEDKTRFMSRNQFAIFEKEMNPIKENGVLNKLVFKIYAKNFSLPVPRMYGLYDPSFGFDPEGGDLKTYDQFEKIVCNPKIKEFIIKPIGADMSLGIKLCKKNDDGSFESVGEGKISLKDLYDQMQQSHYNKQEAINDSYLIEERVRQHPFLDNFTDSCTQTCRIVTFINRSGGIDIATALMKFGMADKPADNISAHGMGAGIDPEGYLGPCIKPTPEGLIVYQNHPETDYPIEGQRLPLYKEAVSLAKRAQSVIPQMRMLGWDIAITETGPVIIEGNSRWGIEVMQYIPRRGLIRNSLGKELYEILSRY
jgi:Sugar-transfer associated ATP-grasp